MWEIYSALSACRYQYIHPKGWSLWFLFLWCRSFHSQAQRVLKVMLASCFVYQLLNKARIRLGMQSSSCAEKIMQMMRSIGNSWWRNGMPSFGEWNPSLMMHIMNDTTRVEEVRCLYRVSNDLVQEFNSTWYCRWAGLFL
jgi:hypothetical protein